jgi:hypothetical protein
MLPAAASKTVWVIVALPLNVSPAAKEHSL